MKKNLLLTAALCLLFACNNNDFGGSGVNPAEQPLITGNTSQPNVDYNSNVSPLSFEFLREEGDSTFLEAGIDFNSNNARDLVFTLVRWSDKQVLTVRSRDSYEIPFSGSDFELISIGVSIPGVNIVGAGVELNNVITNFTSLTDGFMTNTNGNSVSTSANMLLWNGVAYIPFRNNNSIGWIGVSISNGAGVQIEAINVTTIAIREN